MEKKKIVISSITVAVLLVLVVTSSYAYFQARIASSGQTSTSVGAKTLDSFAINTGSDISLIANQDNFALGKGDLSSSTTASVTFTARNDEASSYAYYAGFYIANNTFEDSGIMQQKIGSDDKGLGIVDYENKDNWNYAWNPNSSKYKNNIFMETWDSISPKSNEENIGGKTFDFIYKMTPENTLSIDDFTPNIELTVQRYTDSDCGFFNYWLGVTITEKKRYDTSDGEVYYKYTIETPENIAVAPTSCGLSNMFYVTYGQAKSGKFYSGIYVIDKSSTLGQSYTTLPYVQGYESELELTIKKNGEVLGTYDITNSSSGDYISFKEYDNNEANEVYINTGNQCLLTGLVRIDPVKYATIEACGDDLDCGLNAYQEIVNACNGDEDCQNLIYADLEQLYPACVEKANIEANKVRGYGISANAGATTTDTWEATVTFKNLDGNQNLNAGKSFEGYFQIYSYKDISSDEIKLSNYVKCMQKWYPSFVYGTDYDTFVSETCNGDEKCKNQIDDRIETCNNLWFQSNF